MENGKVKVWLPAIQAGSGTDVYTRRLADALEQSGVTACITWFPLSHELLPLLLRHTRPPVGSDIVIANSWTGYAFRGFDLPLVVIVHHSIFDSHLRQYKSAAQSYYHRYIAEPREGKSVRAADAVVAVSNHVAEGLRRRLDVDNVRVIYNWVDTDVFRPSPHQALGGRPFRLLFVGKPKRLKGGDMLGPIMSRLGDTFELRIAADSRDFRQVELPTNMIPIGRLVESELIRAYQECDAVLSPSHSEGFGYVALEAMACGKPVIAGNNSAMPEIVVEGVTGSLCDTGDINEIAEAIRTLGDDARLCLSLGNAGRQRAIELFTESVARKQYLGLIDALLAK